MTKRLLSLALSLAMLLTMTPLVVGAAESTATVKIGYDTTLTDGGFYVAASDEVPGPPANVRVVDQKKERPESNYLEYNDGTLTVHGTVALTSSAQNVIAVSSGALTITGEAGSSLTLTHTSGYAMSIAGSASVQLTGAVNLTATTTSAAVIDLNGALTSENYSGDVTISGNTSAINSDGKLVLETRGAIQISRSATNSMNPVVFAKELTLQGKSVTVTGGGTLLSSGADLNVTATEGDLSFVSDSTTKSILISNGTTTLSAPETITVTSALDTTYPYVIGGQRLVLNNAKKATLTCTGSGNLMASVQEQIESNVGTLVLTQNGKTTVTKGDKTYDGDITTAGLNYTNGLPATESTYLAGEGTAVFTPGEVPTLTLKDATAGDINLGDNSFNIVVEGENTIGRVDANSAIISVTGKGSLAAARLASIGTNNEVNVNIEGVLSLNSTDGATVIVSKATISAKSIKIKGTYGFTSNSTNVPVMLTATDGDIRLEANSADSYFVGSDIQLTMNAMNGDVVSENAIFWGITTIEAEGNISLRNSLTSNAIIINSLTAVSKNGNINIDNTKREGYAIQRYGNGEINLSASNGRVSVSAERKTIDASNSTVTISAKEVSISSKYEYGPTINAKQVDINGDKVTITGYGGSGGDYSYAVVYANGTIESKDLLIRAETGYAVAPQYQGTLALKGAGKVIGKAYDTGITHDEAIELLGAPVSVLTSGKLEEAKTKTVFNAGSGYTIYDPENKTFLLQDAVISNSVSLPIDDVAVTINGSLTIESGMLSLGNTASVTVEPNAPISLGGFKASLTLPATATAEDLNSLNLSGTGSVGYGNKYGEIVTLVYDLDGGENASANPTTYIGFATADAPEGYYPIALSAPTKEGYDFKGWYSDTEYTNKVDAIVADLPVNTDTHTLTLYAKWEKQAQNNGGSSGGSSSSSSNAVTPPSKTENGTVSVGAKNAKKGDTVTITVTPDSGYQVGQVTVKDASGNTVAVKDLGGGKYSFVMPATKVSVDASFVKEAAPAADFADVAANAWYKGAVDYVVQKGLMTGTGEKAFSPESPMTRAMLMTVLARYAGEDTSGGATWYEKGMAWAVANGVSDGSNPAGNITREQLVTMLYRYAGSPKTSGSLAAFADADAVSAYAVQAMQWAVEQGIITGTTATTITPQGNATRAQVATILMRFCQGRDA